MSKLVPPISGIACFLWVTLWSWWLSSNKFGQDSQSASPSFSFSVAHDGFQFEANEPFYFLRSDAVAYMSDDAVSLLDSLANYLSHHPDEVLTLTGTYSTDETNKTVHANLGIARAEALKEFLVGENKNVAENIKTASQQTDNTLLYTGKWMGGVNFTFSKATAEKEVEDTPAPNAEKASAQAADLIITFAQGSYELDKSYLPKLGELRDYLRSNPSEVATLHGFSQKEEEKVQSGDLAELRAKAVRRYLVDNGVRRKQIKVSGRSASTAHHVEVIIE